MATHPSLLAWAISRSLVDYSPGVCIELDMTEAIENKLAKEWCIHGREKEIDKKKKKKPNLKNHDRVFGDSEKAKLKRHKVLFKTFPSGTMAPQV